MSTLSPVALFLPSLVGGGVRRVMVNLACGLAGEGLPVDLVLARAEGPYLSELPPQVRVVDLDSRRVGQAVPGLVRYLRRTRPQALLAAMEHANLSALIARIISGVPVKVAISVHALYSQEVGLFPHRRNRVLVPFLVRWLYPRASAVIAVSESVADDLAHAAGISREKIRVIYNPVVTPRLRELLQELPDHPWFVLKDDESAGRQSDPPEQPPPVILSAGRLTPEKDFETLIRAFHLLRPGRKARLVILGEGPLREELEGLIGELGLTDRIRLPGFVSNPYSYMARAALFVLSSRREGFGNVLVEALAAGTKIVSTACPGGPAEILDQGRYGCLVPPGDKEALVEAIEQALDLTPLPQLLRQRAEDFSIERILPMYREVLNV